MELQLNSADLDLLQKTKLDLQEFCNQKAESNIFRSKVNFYELGEKPSSYYLSMERARFNARTCNALFDEEGNLISDTNGILKLQQKFYSALYSRDTEVAFIIENESPVKVPENISEQQNMQFTIEDIGMAVLQLPNNKTCGNDGIPIDFYKVFWSKIKHIYYELVLEIFKKQHFHDSALLGVINLIPKATKDTRYLKFLRPISLLSSDYKIIKKAMANKIEPALEHIIDKDQRGFQKNRRISSNIRMIFELIQHSEKENLDNIILQLDFEKCFDKIEFDILFKSLHYFGFPDIVQTWTKILFTDFRAMTQNNGHFSEVFKITRGLHQGGPCSSLYFLICAEIMAILLRQNPNIEGILVNQIKNLLGQYADDADVYLRNRQKSLDTVFEVLENFRRISGFCVNYDKTTILRIGSLKNTNATLIMQKKVVWTNDFTNVLGIWIHTSLDKAVTKNYNDLLEKARNVMQK